MVLRTGYKVSDHLFAFFKGGGSSQYRVFDVLYGFHRRYRKAGKLSGRMGPQEYAEEFIIDAWQGLNSVKPADGATVADVGTGAGYPGIPWRLFRPDLRVTLIERNARKAEYLHLVTKELDLTGIEVINAPAEDVDRCFNVVTAKGVGVGTLNVINRLLVDGGKAIIFCKGDEKVPVNAGGLTLSNEYYYVLPFRNARRKVAVYSTGKVSRET
jgi:16S rRNA (guanine(527)-N(7))-methyltransferase RsmG